MMTCSELLRATIGTSVLMAGFLPLGCSTGRMRAEVRSHREPVIMIAPGSGGDGSGDAHAALREELLAMMAVDQDARMRMLRATKKTRDSIGKKILRVDKRNTKRMKRIIAEHGWPTRTMVGEDGAQAAWLLVQHADQDVAFQRRCLKLMEPLVSGAEVSPGNVAYLTDRVLVHEGKPQVYGTQFHTVDGKQQPFAIIEPGHVDKRRKAMGLSTLAEYTELMHTLPGG